MTFAAGGPRGLRGASGDGEPRDGRPEVLAYLVSDVSVSADVNVRNRKGRGGLAWAARAMLQWALIGAWRRARRREGTAA